MIWLASFPRSGNTFARNVLHDVYGLESTEVNQKVFAHSSTHHEFPVVKTHLLPRDMEAFNTDDIIVCLVRDGRDAIVSIAHHRTNIVEPGSDLMENLKLAVEAQKGSYFGGWDRNVAEWMRRAHVVIRFEDLIREPVQQMEKIRPFLKDLPQPDVNQVPTFESQRKGDPKYGPPGKKKLFFRKGEVGDWKNTMPHDLEQMFWSKAGDVMQILGYEKDGTITPFQWSEKKRTYAKKAIKKRVTIREKLSGLIKTQDPFIHFSSKSKIHLQPRLVYYKALATSDPFIRLINESSTENEVAIVDMDENLEIKITHPDDKSVSNFSDIKILISHLSHYYLNMAIHLSGEPMMISGVIDPIQHIADKYMTIKEGSNVSDNLEENNDFIQFSRDFKNRNMFSRVISKHSKQLNLVWTPDNYQELINHICQELDWQYHNPRFPNLNVSQEVIENLSRYNKKDLDVFHHFSTQDAQHEKD